MANPAGNPNMKMLIPMINELQRIFTLSKTRLTLTLPQIAVVGSQSAGKSSVLENIVGRDFLPRGGSMVTKRPLILQLVSSEGPEYGVFGHKPQHRYTNYADIRKEIENDTKAVVREDMGVSNLPINLTIYSPYVVNLTLVDLPGMVKVPSQGQPVDIVKKIDDIILEYISNENCLILAVTPANIDIVTSDALVMARSKDPMGKRTIGVLTKLDMMGQGHDAREVLLNKVVVLERGFIGVVLRGQRFDEYGRPMKELDIPGALEFERQFFSSAPAYRDMADRMGVPYLQRTLSIQLTEHILKCLPDLKRELQARHRALTKEASEFSSSAMLDGNGFDNKALVIVTHELQESFEAALKGSNTKEFDLTHLTGGARIASIFKNAFPSELARADVQDKDMRTQVALAIKSIRGFRSGIFIPDEAFEYIVRMQIAKFEEPVMKCVDMVVSELKRIIHEVTSKLKRYPFLQQITEELLMNHVKEAEVNAKQACSIFINTQLSYINTTNEEFIGYANAEKSVNAADNTRTVTKQVIRKGFLRIQSGTKLFQGKPYFFVLTTDNLSWYNDADEKEKKYMLQLESLKLRNTEGGFVAKRPQFALFCTDGRNVYKEHRTIELFVDSKEEMENWREAFARAGVYSDRAPAVSVDTNPVVENSSGDPHLDRQVETINILVISYMRIVGKMTRDFVPKTIVFYVIQTMRKYISRELLANLYSIPNSQQLLKESAEERQRRETTLVEFEAVKSALKIIDDFQTNSRRLTTTFSFPSTPSQSFSNSTVDHYAAQPVHHPLRQVNSTYVNGSVTPPLTSVSQRPPPRLPPRPSSALVVSRQN